MPTSKEVEKNTVVDVSTGEIVSQTQNIREVTSRRIPPEPPYIKLYMRDIMYLKDLPKTHEKLLYALLKRSTWASAESGMIVTVSAGLKRLIAKELDIKNSRSINNALTDFVKADILKRLETGVYQFNPYLFGRGDWRDIDRLRMTVDYTLEGKSFATMIAYRNAEEEAAASNPAEPANPTDGKTEKTA